MKKLLLIICPIILVLIILLSVVLFYKKDQHFFLEDEYYKDNTINEIEISELNKLIKNKESFALFIYQSMCITSSDFEEVLNDFLTENKISIYKIPFSSIKDTEISKYVKYYPSFVLYNKGKMIDYLEADKDEDLKYYSSKESFKDWFTKYVNLKDNSSNQNNNQTQIKELNKEEILSKVNLEHITKESKKTNLYFFWGNGCPHCEEEFNFLKSIEEEYGEYFNLYRFEVWYDKNNASLLELFATTMGDKVTGVPYTIIGNKSFIGFSEKYHQEFIKAITNYENNYDVYFDKIR